MVCYKIELKKSVKKSLASLPKPLINKITGLIDALANDPYPPGYKKLIGSDHTYRIRTGDHRIIYSVFDDCLTIHIIKLGHRKDVYK
jgi:mRNA interferase RelE/StbE